MQIIFLNSKKEIRSIWWIVIYFIILSLLLFPSIIIAQKFSLELSIGVQAIIILAATLVCQMLKRKSLYDITGKINLAWFKNSALGVTIGLILMACPALFLTALGYLSWSINDSFFSTAVSGVGIFLAVAVAEELLFRGFLFQHLMKAFGQWPAQIIIAGLFLLTHINNPGMSGNIKILASVNIFIASILFGLAYIKTRSLAMPIGLHFMANYVQGTVLGFGVSGSIEYSIFSSDCDGCPPWLNGGDFGLEASLLGLLTLICLTILLYNWNSKTMLPTSN